MKKLFFLSLLFIACCTTASLAQSSEKIEISVAPNSFLFSVRNDTTSRAFTESTPTVVADFTFGAVAGAVLGVLISAPLEGDELVDALRGAMIGGMTLPFVLHEIGRKLRSKNTKRGSFNVKIGTGYTFPNCANAKTHAGITLGLGRLYQIGKHTGIRAEVVYATRKFSQSSYSEAYPAPDPRRYRHTKVDFSVGYIETALLFEVRLLRSQRVSLLFALGPSNSVVVLDHSHFETTDTPNAPTSSQECHVAHQYEEPAESWFYPSLNLGLIAESHHVMLGIGFKRALYGSQQIARLDDHSRFNSLEVTAGYKF